MNRLPEGAFDTEWIKEPFRLSEGERYEDTKYALTRNGIALPAKVRTFYILDAYDVDGGTALVFATDWFEALPAERKALLPDNEPDWTSPEHLENMSRLEKVAELPAGFWRWRFGGKVPLNAEEAGVWREYALRHDLPQDPGLGLKAYYREHVLPEIRWPRIRIYLLDRRGRIRDHIAVGRIEAVPNLQVVQTDRQSIEFSLFSPTEVFRLRILDRPRLTWLPRPFWHGKLGCNWMVVELGSPGQKA